MCLTSVTVKFEVLVPFKHWNELIGLPSSNREQRYLCTTSRDIPSTHEANCVPAGRWPDNQGYLYLLQGQNLADQTASCGRSTGTSTTGLAFLKILHSAHLVVTATTKINRCSSTLVGSLPQHHLSADSHKISPKRLPLEDSRRSARLSSARRCPHHAPRRRYGHPHLSRRASRVQPNSAAWHHFHHVPCTHAPATANDEQTRTLSNSHLYLASTQPTSHHPTAVYKARRRESRRQQDPCRLGHSSDTTATHSGTYTCISATRLPLPLARGRRAAVTSQ